MTFLYTNTYSFKLFIKNCDPYELKKIRLKDYIDTSNFSTSTVFPLELGKNEICLGKLNFENRKCPCFKFNAKAAKKYEEKRINQYRSVKAK